MKYITLFILITINISVFSQVFIIDKPMEKIVNGVLAIENVPDGNYLVKVVVGSKNEKGHTVIRGESRRLFFDPIITRKGRFKEVSFIINKRNTFISDSEHVRIKEREKNKLNWDNNLSLEFAGINPCVEKISVSPAENVTTIYLCGNSTVVDQDNEPWASWGQIITKFFDTNISFANYAESGESANTFIAAKRFKKILTVIKPGDYIFIEFGHNDQKQTGEGKGPYLHYYKSLAEMIIESRALGAIPVLLTPTQRRNFNKSGQIVNTHGEYPQAMKQLATDLNVPLIDLHEKTKILFEKMGVENSKNAFVHYPANSFPNQIKPLQDNTHFNPFGATQVAKCVINGIIEIDLPVKKFIHKCKTWSPYKPDEFKKFVWYNSPYFETEKPDGN